MKQPSEWKPGSPPRKRLKVYVAGPYSKPNPNHNTNRAVLLGDQLWQMGYWPYVPHLSHFWDTLVPHPYEHWLEYDLVWLEACDVVFRFSGESSGADKEVAHAEKLGIPVVYNLRELVEVADEQAKKAGD